MAAVESKNATFSYITSTEKPTVKIMIMITRPDSSNSCKSVIPSVALKQ